MKHKVFWLFLAVLILTACGSEEEVTIPPTPPAALIQKSPSPIPFLLSPTATPAVEVASTAAIPPPTLSPPSILPELSQAEEAVGTARDLWQTYGRMNIVDLAVAGDAVWVGTWQGVFRFDLRTERFDNYSRGLKMDMPVLSLAVDQVGQVWVGSGFTGLAPGDSHFGSLQQFDGDQWRTHTNLSPATPGLPRGAMVELVAVDHIGHVWSNTAQGFAEYDGQSWTPHLKVSDFKDMAVDSQGRRWFCGDTAITVFDGSRWTHYDLKNELPMESCFAVAGDRFGTMWFGSSNGLHKFDGDDWISYTAADGLANDLVRTIAIDQAGQIWVGHGHTGAGVSRYDGAHWTTYTVADGLPSNEVNRIAVDQAGHIWFGTSRGLSRFISSSVAPFVDSLQVPPTVTSLLPLLQPIQPDNAAQLVEITRLGQGIVKDFAWLPDKNLLGVAAVSGLYLYEPYTLRQVRFFATDSSPVALDFSPDGSVLVAALADSSLVLWEVSSGHFLQTLNGHTGFIFDVAFSPDGHWLASASGEGTLRLWDVDKGQERYSLSVQPYSRFRFSPDSRWLATGGGKWNRLVQVWDLSTGQSVAALEISPDLGDDLAFSPDSQRLMILPTGEMTTPVLLWDFATGETDRFQHTESFSRAALGPDEVGLATADFSGAIRLWNLSGEERRMLGRHADTAFKLVFSPDGRLLASADSTHLKIWDSYGGEIQEDLALDGVSHLRFSNDSNHLAFRRGGTVGLVNLASGQIRFLPGHSDLITSLAFSPDNKWLAVGDWSGLVHVWDRATGQPQPPLKSHAGPVGSLVFNPNGHILVSGGLNEDPEVVLWQTETWELLESFTGDTDYPMQSLTFSPDGDMLAGAGLTGVILRDINTGTMRRLEGHSEPVLSVAISPDGRRLASGSFDETVIVWDLLSGQMLKTLPGHSMGAASLVFSPGARWLLSGDQQNKIRAWSVETGALLQTIDGRGQDLALSPDGTLLAFNENLDHLILWDIFRLEEVVRLTGERPFTFSPDGRLLVSGSEDGLVTLWGVK